MKAPLPPSLPVGVARELVAATDEVWRLRPWKFMSDMHVVGVRDDVTRELRIATVLGAMREVFAVILYRHPAGLGWIHSMVCDEHHGDGNRTAMFEGMDHLKVEWCPKQELERPDLELLESAGFRTSKKGSSWPRFQTSTPGWLPWFLTSEEAQQLTVDLRKVSRFAQLFRKDLTLYEDHLRGDLPIVPGGDGALRKEDVDWTPVVLPPASAVLPVLWPKATNDLLARLPLREDVVFECTAEMVPEMPILEKNWTRPQLSRVGLLTDRRSYHVFATHCAAGFAPPTEALAGVLHEGLTKAGVRPGEIHVRNEAVAALLQPACATLGIKVVPSGDLSSADEALTALTEYLRGAR
jgi:hypothetical protein